MSFREGKGFAERAISVVFFFLLQNIFGTKYPIHGCLVECGEPAT
jgi:hypothetical protein